MRYETITLKLESTSDSERNRVLASLFESLVDAVDENSFPKPGERNDVKLTDMLQQGQPTIANARIEVREGIDFS